MTTPEQFEQVYLGTLYEDRYRRPQDIQGMNLAGENGVQAWATWNPRLAWQVPIFLMSRYDLQHYGVTPYDVEEYPDSIEVYSCHDSLDFGRDVMRPVRNNMKRTGPGGYIPHRDLLPAIVRYDYNNRLRTELSYHHGQLQSYDDNPAIKSFRTTTCWGPGRLVIDPPQDILQWYDRGTRHRAEGPAYVSTFKGAERCFYIWRGLTHNWQGIARDSGPRGFSQYVMHGIYLPDDLGGLLIPGRDPAEATFGFVKWLVKNVQDINHANLAPARLHMKIFLQEKKAPSSLIERIEGALAFVT